jgi:adenylate kinase
MNCYAFIGIQGSGKGTQAVKLSAYLNYQHVNIGDLFRNNIHSGTKLGQQVQEIIQQGRLVPDSTVFELIKNSEAPEAKGIVFDGFPRTVPQAEYLLQNYNLKRVFYLDLSEDTALERIKARRVCQNCGENYNLTTQPPAVQGVCDVCGGSLIIRDDDKPEAIHKRFKEFNKQTLPLKAFFSEHNLLLSIPAEGSITEIFEQILNNLS